MLLRRDHVSAVEPWSSDVEYTVKAWPDLVKALRPLLTAACNIAEERDASLSIEFVTNVFDIAPHLVTMAESDTQTIGEQHPVTLRLRKSRSKDARQPWVERADAIREGTIKTDIHGVDIGNAVLAPCRVLFVRHLLPEDSRPRHPQPPTPEWQLVSRAIAAGVPFICWPLRPGAKADCTDYQADLATWVKQSKPLDTMPARIRSERSNGTMAVHVSVFWDDPLPVYQLREIRQR
ncbi:hypothetical protein BH18ACI5_BH18ACI5_27690 [soil metagenome]